MNRLPTPAPDRLNTLVHVLLGLSAVVAFGCLLRESVRLSERAPAIAVALQSWQPHSTPTKLIVAGDPAATNRPAAKTPPGRDDV